MTEPCPKRVSVPTGKPVGPNGGPTLKPNKPLPPVGVRTDEDRVPS